MKDAKKLLRENRATKREADCLKKYLDKSAQYHESHRSIIRNREHVARMEKK